MRILSSSEHLCFFFTLKPPEANRIKIKPRQSQTTRNGLIDTQQKKKKYFKVEWSEKNKILAK